MAVVEIAKIQIRRGDARSIGMPQLDTGELGWAISGTSPNSVSPELYVGNKQADGAPANTNVRILTANDLNIFSGASVSTSTFIYSGNKTAPGGTGAIIATGDVGTDVVRTVEQKLNDIVSAADFGVFPEDDAVTTTIALQRAVDQLFLNADKYDPGSRVILVIPQGAYNISDTIYVPSYATIVGAGKDKTAFVHVGVNLPVFQFIDQASSSGNRITLTAINTAPSNITIKGMSFQMSLGVAVNSMAPFIKADCATDSDIVDVAFRGRLDVGYSTTNLNSVGIEIRGQGATTSRNLKIRDCLFQQMNCGIKSDYDIEDTLIENNRFEKLYRGIMFGKNLVSGNQTGPKRSRINKNIFVRIAREAISIEPINFAINTDHISSQNTFYNVGNNGVTTSTNITGDLTDISNPNGGQVTEIIKFGTFGNVSDNDYFDRTIQMNNTSTVANYIIPVSGHVSLIDNKVRVKTLLTATNTGTFLRLPGNSDITNINIQYHLTLNNNAISRWGNLYIVMAAGQIADITDTYRYVGNDDGGMSFDATYDGTIGSGGHNIINITYSKNTGSGQITYQYNQYY
jgi:hypothetical protein